jgi:hypothetical protein
MPLTPLHFGPSSAISLPLHKYLDVPVFLLVNVLIDVEPIAVMIFNLNYPLHGFIHTFLFGALLGVLFAFVAFLAKDAIQKFMKITHFPYEPNLYKMIAAGTLGALLHVFLDSIYHGDIQPFFPVMVNPFYELISQDDLERFCSYAFMLAIGFYFIGICYLRHQGKKERELDNYGEEISKMLNT